MTKPRLLLLCGGQSGEHEVSLASARSVINAAGDQFDVTPLVITKTGQLLSGEASGHALSTGSSDTVSMAPYTSGNLPKLQGEAFDVVFPLLHGPYGEDGTVQGLLRLMNLPFVGSDVLGSAVGMDKLMMKRVFAAEGLPQVPYRGVKRHDWRQDPDQVLHSLQELTYPLFVKPANLGSSVGISKARNEQELRDAIGLAAHYDRRIIIEQGVSDVRELEIGILGNDNPEASPVGEISYQSDFYDYTTKYTEGHATLQIPAKIPRHVAQQCTDLALRAFSALDAAGLARIDFFYQEASDTLYINEINTMPGFTTTSMYPRLWEAAGVSYAALVERLVTLALERH